MARRSQVEIECDEWNEKHFLCDECGTMPEVMYMFGDYGNNPLKVEDSNQYCQKHFDKKDKEYDRLHTRNSK